MDRIKMFASLAGGEVLMGECYPALARILVEKQLATWQDGRVRLHLSEPALVYLLEKQLTTEQSGGIRPHLTGISLENVAGDWRAGVPITNHSDCEGFDDVFNLSSDLDYEKQGSVSHGSWHSGELDAQEFFDGGRKAPTRIVGIERLSDLWPTEPNVGCVFGHPMSEDARVFQNREEYDAWYRYWITYASSSDIVRLQVEPQNPVTLVRLDQKGNARPIKFP